MFTNLIMKLRQFMTERYGNDPLNIALFAAGCVVTFVLSLFAYFFLICWIRVFSYLPFILAVLRMLSKNTYQRQKENEKFMRMSAPLMSFFKKKASHLSDKEHRYFDCPVCKNTLRVPADRGKIEITCPHCGKKFKRRT
ncbi:MAG: zf-TFIIB domain-containing protein [Clostridia bacterium]|nr:zf-TFIIB domain-containing protein [Clostridia bacterium]